MRKLWVFAIIGIICACASTGASNTVDLDAAIQQASKEINVSLPQGTKVALLNFNSDTDVLSDYVLEEMSIALVKAKKLVVVDRKEIDLIRREMDFQMSGDVSDESAQEIGKMLGAQSIVSGSLINMGETYRFRTKVINVISAAIQTSSSISVADDPQIRYLLGQSGKSSPQISVVAAPAQAVSSGQSQRPQITPLRWTVGYYTNEWGDNTGKYYVQYDGTVSGIYSNTWDNNGSTTIREISFSQPQGFTFKDSKNPALFMNQPLELYIHLPNGDEKKFTGIYYDSSNVGHIPYSQDLLRMLLEEDIDIRFIVSVYRCQWKFPPQFRHAYEALVEREKKEAIRAE